MKTLLLLVSLITNPIWGSTNPNAFKKCQDFKKVLEMDAIAQGKSFEVPEDYSNKENSTKLNIFYWHKKGDASQTPILLIHGGVGGNSSNYYNTFKNDVANYKGDVIAVDLRNEGCSNVSEYNLPVEAYKTYRVRDVVRDLEILRTNLFGSKKWKIFGQSRGAAIAQYYFEMFPQSISSLGTHGFSVGKSQTMKNYTFLRSTFSARTSNYFEQENKDASVKLKLLKKYFSENKICLDLDLNQENLPLDQREKLCGEIVVDSLSFQFSSYGKWGKLVSDINSLFSANNEVIADKANAYFRTSVNINVYTQYLNYIRGTNSQDFSAPNPDVMEAVKNDPFIKNALISEGRFLFEGLYPIYLKKYSPEGFKANVDPINFKKVRFSLNSILRSNDSSFNYTIFSSKYDPIGGHEMFKDQLSMIGGQVKYHKLENSGHDGWAIEPSVKEWIFNN